MSNDDAANTSFPKELAIATFPNPTTGFTTFSVEITQPQTHVKLDLFNALGRRVRVLLDETLAGGTHRVDSDLSNLGPGTYYYRLYAGDRIHTRSLIKY